MGMMEMGKGWAGFGSRVLTATAVADALRWEMYRKLAKEGVQETKRELDARVYSKSGPKPRTMRTRQAVTTITEKLGVVETVSGYHVDRSHFPGYYYPWVLEKGSRLHPNYFGRWFFRTVTARMWARYLIEGKMLLREQARLYARTFRG